METTNRPISVKCNVSAAPPECFSLFAIVKQICVFRFAKFGKWISLSDTPGTLTIACNERNENKKSVYEIAGEFRVKNATPKNTTYLQLLANGAVIMYKSGNGKMRIAGTKQYPLKFTLSEPNDFEGYVCSFTGITSTPIAFVNPD